VVEILLFQKSQRPQARRRRASNGGKTAQQFSWRASASGSAVACGRLAKRQWRLGKKKKLVVGGRG